MKTKVLIGLVLLSILVSVALAFEDKYTVKVPGGLAFSEFRGYESWQRHLHQSERKGDGDDPWQSRDDKGLSGGFSR